MKIKQLEWIENNIYYSGEPILLYITILGIQYLIKNSFKDNYCTLYSLYSRKLNDEIEKIATSLDIEELKQIAQQHFENEIRKYLED